MKWKLRLRAASIHRSKCSCQWLHRELKEINVFTVSLSLHLGLIWTEKGQWGYFNVSKYIKLNHTKRFSWHPVGYVIRSKVEEENPAPLGFDISLKRDTIDLIQWVHNNGHQEEDIIPWEGGEGEKMRNHNQFNLLGCRVLWGKGSSLLLYRASTGKSVRLGRRPLEGGWKMDLLVPVSLCE